MKKFTISWQHVSSHVLYRIAAGLLLVTPVLVALALSYQCDALGWMAVGTLGLVVPNLILAPLVEFNDVRISIPIPHLEQPDTKYTSIMDHYLSTLTSLKEIRELLDR